MRPADVTASLWAASVRLLGSSLIPMTSNDPTRPPRPADVAPVVADALTSSPMPGPTGLHISMSYADHLFASDATGVAAAVLSGPRPLGRRHCASSPGPIHTSNPVYVGPYWCTQRRRPVSRATGRHHGVPLGRLRATARIRSDLDGLDRPVAAPEARRRRPR
ncbi:hypothetical protein NDU88_004089 [Pleurodeles waltl]|uniref:Uncharacterized protein n=1 Tax=Pleurodeles waltl TaxID=8319 RepID=A0AAV7WVH9_PLEWA|nr:hypothetical protein NDU88_004089 [Pleurodeles waltl]